MSRLTVAALALLISATAAEARTHRHAESHPAAQPAQAATLGTIFPLFGDLMSGDLWQIISGEPSSSRMPSHDTVKPPRR